MRKHFYVKFNFSNKYMLIMSNNNDSKYNFSNTIKKLKEIYGLTQKELADKLEVSRGTIAQIEMGKNTPTTALIMKILDVFEVNPNMLFDMAINENADYQNHLDNFNHKADNLGVMLNTSNKFNLDDFHVKHYSFIALYDSLCMFHILIYRTGMNKKFKDIFTADFIESDYLQGFIKEKQELYNEYKVNKRVNQLIPDIEKATLHIAKYFSPFLDYIINSTELQKEYDNYKGYIKTHKLIQDLFNKIPKQD